MFHSFAGCQKTIVYLHKIQRAFLLMISVVVIFPLYCRIPLWYFLNHDKLFAFYMKLNSEHMCIQNLRISNAFLNEPKTLSFKQRRYMELFAVSMRAVSVDLDPLYLDN